MCLAIPMKIKSVSGCRAVTELGGVERETDVRFVDGVKPGDYVIVHAGFAIQKLDVEEAEKTLNLFKEIEEGLETSF